jgi:hypothetical protein
VPSDIHAFLPPVRSRAIAAPKLLACSTVQEMASRFPYRRTIECLMVCQAPALPPIAGAPPRMGPTRRVLPHSKIQRKLTVDELVTASKAEVEAREILPTRKSKATSLSAFAFDRTQQVKIMLVPKVNGWSMVDGHLSHIGVEKVAITIMVGS